MRCNFLKTEYCCIFSGGGRS